MEAMFMAGLFLFAFFQRVGGFALDHVSIDPTAIPTSLATSV
jgi:hypothetical protein